MPLGPNELKALEGALKNPGPILKNIGLTVEDLQNPFAASQKLMNSGRINQMQFNAAYQEVQGVAEQNQAISNALSQLFNK